MIPEDRLRRILEEYRSDLVSIFGDDLALMVLYGSQARGESVEGSDIDVLCIMNKPFHYGDMINRTSQATARISLKHDVVISRSFVSVEAYKSRQSPFLMNVHKEQIAL
ncbi:MAG: nucleotidyltransferase domain-containing protein [Desulfobacterales bacterium]|nr:nucleotidyltransferase domain-containing protein [Desulfobacterales bacterium]